MVTTTTAEEMPAEGTPVAGEVRSEAAPVEEASEISIEEAPAEEMRSDEAPTEAPVEASVESPTEASAEAPPARETATWRVLAKSVRGYSHDQKNLPNQDAIRVWPRTGTGLPLAVAVSDGHGSPTYFRSDEGARIAVDVAIKAMQHILAMDVSTPDAGTFSMIKRAAEEQLPQMIVREWRRYVKEHVAQNPFTVETWATVPEKDSRGRPIRPMVEANPALAYGATIMCVGVSERFIVYAQLGDGDILVISEDKQVAEPIPQDNRLMANETTSLCSDSVGADFKVVFQHIVGTPPALILVSTDGYKNSIDEPDQGSANFHSIGPDYLNRIRTQGLDFVERSLDLILSETTRRGSGDDISLAIIRRIEANDEDSKMQRFWQLDAMVDTKLSRDQHAAYAAEQVAIQQNMRKELTELDARLSSSARSAAEKTAEDLEAIRGDVGTLLTAQATLSERLAAMESKVGDPTTFEAKVDSLMARLKLEQILLVVVLVIAVAIVLLQLLLYRG